MTGSDPTSARGMHASSQHPRTIVLVMVDQLAAKWLEAATDGDVVDLPAIDALRADGVTFTRAFTPNPVCSPARASLLTGMRSPAHGLTECGYRLDPAVPTLPRALQEHGWRTGLFGKLHVVPQIETLTPDYRPYGFEVARVSEDNRAGEWTAWVRRTHPEHYRAALATVWMTMVDELRSFGPEHEDLHAEILQARREFPECTTDAYVLPFPAEVSQSAWITDRAIEFLDGAGDSDVFAQVSYVQPHNPFAPPPEYVDRVRVDNIPEPVPAEWMSDPIPYYASQRYARPSYADRDWRRDRQLYFADLAHLDHELGRLRTALERTGRSADALVVFTSDHGELLHDHGLLGKWERHYDACIRVPLIVVGEGLEEGGVNNRLVDLTDVTATMHDWADVAGPTAPVREADGGSGSMSLLAGSSLLAPPPDERMQVLIESNGSHTDPGPRSWARTLRTASLRYTRHLAGGGDQLFHLDDDPDETVNLAAEPAYAAERARLLEELADGAVTQAFPPSSRQLFRLGSW